MAFLAGAFVTLFTAAMGCALSILLANKCVFWYRIPAHDGQSGYFVLLIAVIGTLVGLVIGIVLSSLHGTGTIPDFVSALVVSVCCILCLSGVAGLLARAAADVPPTLDGRPINLVLEIRLPVGDPDPSHYSVAKSYITFDSVDPKTHVQRKSERGVLGVSTARKEGERWILPATVSIFTARGDRTTMVVLEDKIRGGFLLPLPGHPRHQFDHWSDWLPRQKKDGSHWPETEMSYRFRVQPVP